MMRKGLLRAALEGELDMQYKGMMILVAILGTLVTACGAPSAPPIVPTPPASVLPTQPPSPLPGQNPAGDLATELEEEAWKGAPAAALNSRADLAQRLNVDPGTIKLISIEPVDWPDGCLGIQQPDVMCIMVITPGYQVVLEADGKQYEYHTNQDGSSVKLATDS
jgi:hypothetical protein